MYVLRRLISNYIFERAEICSAWQGKSTSPATQKLCMSVKTQWEAELVTLRSVLNDRKLQVNGFTKTSVATPTHQQLLQQAEVLSNWVRYLDF